MISVRLALQPITREHFPACKLEEQFLHGFVCSITIIIIFEILQLSFLIIYQSIELYYRFVNSESHIDGGTGE